MTTDTSRTLAIESSHRKLLVFVVIGVLMTAASLAVAMRLPGIALLYIIVGYFGAAFFGLCTCVGVWRLLTSRGPVITISPEGIRDTRVSVEVIPWSAVSGISTWEYSGQKAMVVALKPGVEEGLGLTSIARWTRDANRALGADGLCVTASGLKIDYDTLLQTSMDYARTAERKPLG